MLLEEIFFAKTLEDAKSLAVQKFGVPQSDITFEVLEEPKKVFFKVKGEFKVKASYNQVDEEVSIEIPQQTVESTVENVEIVESAVETPIDDTIADTTINEVSVSETLEDVSVEPVQEVTNIQQDVEVEVSSTDTESTVEPIESISNQDDEEIVPTPEELLEKAKIAQSYVTRILEKMGVDTESEIIQNENGVVIDFKGDGTGTIIGKRGETLDALQYLSAMICNKNEKGYYRITLDSCGYRAKRKVILQELAQKVSKNVLRTGRSQALEPMNPYERRIIHATISEIDGVTSRSVGEEPFRKVIISSENPAPKRYNNRKGGYRGNNNNKRGGRGNNNHGKSNKYHGNGKKRNYQPRSLDLKTSFEKDYRKPKPEDNLNAGLYGKIEF